MRSLARLVIPVVALAVPGCGSDGNAARDLASGADLASSTDGGAGGDLAMTLRGTRIVAGDLDLVGVTSDGWVAYTDPSSALFVVRASGGAPTQLGVNAVGGVERDVVFAWHDTDGNGNGPLLAWTAAGGPKPLATMSPSGTGAVSPDGKLVTFYENLSADATTADLTIARVDGSGAKTLLRGVELALSSCPAQLDFVGARAVISHCPRPNDAGVSTATVESFDATGAKATLLASGSPDFFGDLQGTRVVVMDDAGGQIVPVAGGAPIIASLPGLRHAAWSSDGSAVVYSTGSGALRRVAAQAMASPVTLQASGVQDLDALSPDGNSALYHSQTGAAFTDLLLASASAPSTPIALVPDTSGVTGGAFGDSFSADSSFALYGYSADPATTVASLAGKPVAGGSLVPLGAFGTQVIAATASTVVWSDHFTAVGNSGGDGDLHVVDVKIGGPGALLATQAKIDWNLTPDRKSVVYSKRSDGIYVAPLL